MRETLPIILSVFILSCVPIIGWTPAFESSSENSKAPLKL
jgi:hypothetical protein